MSDILPTLLRGQGLRVTPQRAVIYDIIGAIEGHAHLTAQEVYDQARSRLPGLNVATVYRTLETLHGAGLVDMMGTPGAGEVRFSLRDPRRRHAHLLCRGCRAELEIPLEVVERMAREVSALNGFEVDVDHLTFPGVCGKCAAG
ncbi:MAG: transcriptional repressor [Armatimonadetes bacterium]|nr:transcriptional repressor [Armatimonadota bacterium]